MCKSLGDNMNNDYGLSSEAVDFVKETVLKDGRWMAMIAKAVYEKYGEEAIEVICEEFYKFGVTEGIAYKKAAGYEGREDEIDVEVVMTKIYNHVFKHLRVAGFQKQIKKIVADEFEADFFRCPILDSWKTVWDKPWLMCKIAKFYDEGFMHGVNPKLEWTHYPEKCGQCGLARGESSEKLRLILS